MQWPWLEIKRLEFEKEKLSSALNKEKQDHEHTKIYYGRDKCELRRLKATGVKIEYIPVASNYTNSYQERWGDKDYLSGVVTISSNNVLMSELLQAVRDIRDVADGARHPEELNGVNNALKIAKRLLTISAEAAKKLKDMKDMEKANKEVALGHSAR